MFRVLLLPYFEKQMATTRLAVKNSKQKTENIPKTEKPKAIYMQMRRLRW